VTIFDKATTEDDKREYIVLFVVLCSVGIILLSTSISGPFTIDEINYLVTVVGLRDGAMTVPGTEGLTPSKELYAFDPDAHRRAATKTPVFSVAPPLYGILALPLLPLGWRGLVLLNTLALLLTALGVFLLVRKLTSKRQTAWIAVLLTLLGGSFLEYSQGVWPHMLSVALVTISVAFVANVWDGGQMRSAFVGGALIGIAVGIREQNIILASGMGLTILLFGRARLRSALWYAIGTGIPLIVIATMRYYRQGVWHPFPKAIAYSGNVGQQVSGSLSFDPLGTLWTRFVDFSSQPGFTDPMLSVIYRKDLESGALLVDGVVKKALLQSSPWIAVALAVFVGVWIITSWRRNEEMRILKPLSLLVASVVLVFSMLGIGRTDGLAYNQRYFLELVPISAIAVAIMFEQAGGRIYPFVLGLLGSGLMFASVLMAPGNSLQRLAILNVPLLLALLSVVALFLLLRGTKLPFVSVILGLCLGWSLSVHLQWDVAASRNRRMRNEVLIKQLQNILTARSAVFTYGGWRDAAGALVLSRDVVVLDVGADEGQTAGQLAREMDLKGRSVYVVAHGLPAPILRGIAGPDSLALISREPFHVYELVFRR
jgi:hypothetical protein